MLDRPLLCVGGLYRCTQGRARQLAPRLRPFQCQRYASDDIGDRKTGHIALGANEGVLFFNNLYPLNIQWLLRIPGVTGKNTFPKLAGVTINPISIFDKAQSKSSDNASDAAKVVHVLPRIKEGGAFVKFTHSESETPESVTAAVARYLKERKSSAWTAPFEGIRVGLVVGRPWVEDLRRTPSRRLKVEFLPTAPGQPAAELSQEQLYTFFRPYGKLSDIIIQPADSKVTPRYAYLDFAKVAKSIIAKNCMHGYKVTQAQGGGEMQTLLRLSYEEKQKSRWFWDWLSSHPRIVLPLAAALIASITVTVFDPIRTFCIKSHITRTFDLGDNRVYRWFKAQSKELLSRVHLSSRREDEAGMSTIWQDRKGSIEQIQTWLMETADTFIVVQGPRGSGKKELVVDQALKGRKHTLLIDCKPIQEARGDGQTIAAAAASVGYWPVFSWMNSMSGLVDLAAQGATGIKTGFSETLENQLGKIWSNSATALRQIALEGRKKDDKDFGLSEDEYLEAHPERRPVVVIDNFLYKGADGSLFYDKIAEWAASISTTNVAHVIFLTHDVSYNKALGKALPDRVFRPISLSDCTLDVAKRYVLTHLDYNAEDAEAGFKNLTRSQKRNDLIELDDVLPNFGGRLTDLEFLARRVKAGETPRKAEKEMVDQSANEILKIFLAANSNDNDKRAYTVSQAWTLIKQLAKDKMLRYNEVAISSLFSSNGEAALAALEQADLITIQTEAGRPYALRAGRPIYGAAFRRLTQDRVLASKMDLAVLAESTKQENASIDKSEQELQLLSSLTKQPPELADRTRWLLAKIQSSQAKVEAYERDAAKLKDILTTQF